MQNRIQSSMMMDMGMAMRMGMRFRIASEKLTSRTVSQ